MTDRQRHVTGIEMPGTHQLGRLWQEGAGGILRPVAKADDDEDIPEGFVITRHSSGLWVAAAPSPGAIPPGGDENDVLAKASGDDYDTEWIPSGGGGGAVKLLATQTASADSIITFTTRNAPGTSGAIFQSDYDHYTLTIKHARPTATDVTLLLGLSNDGGANWPTASFWHAVHYAGYGAGPSVYQATGQNQMNLTLEGNGVSNDAGWGGVCGKFDLFLGDAVRHTRIIGLANFAQHSNGNHLIQNIGALFLASATTNAIRFYFSSGTTIASGKFSIHGIVD